MYCKQCGKEINDGAQFCPRCGTPVNEMAEEPKRFNWRVILIVALVVCIIGGTVFGVYYKKVLANDSASSNANVVMTTRLADETLEDEAPELKEKIEGAVNAKLAANDEDYVASETEKTTTTRKNATETTKQTTKKTTQKVTRKTTQAAPQKANEFYSPGNYSFMTNAINVTPKYVRYQDGKLYATCYLTSGYSRTVYNISIDKLEFYDKNKNLIASSGFGLLDGLTIAPGGVVEWTFVYSGDTFVNNADLATLYHQSQYQCNY